ncbi:MAG: hypothetical protein ACYTXY_31180 [Nostoc sp.]
MPFSVSGERIAAKSLRRPIIPIISVAIVVKFLSRELGSSIFELGSSTSELGSSTFELQTLCSELGTLCSELETQTRSAIVLPPNSK